MFTKEDFELLSRWGGQLYDSQNNDHIQAREQLNTIYAKVGAWADATNRENWGIQITRNSISPSARTIFTPYHWARLYPSDNTHLAYVVCITENGFVVRIDTYNVTDTIRTQYIDIRNENNIESFLSIEEGIAKSIEELGEWAFQEFAKFQPSYNDILNSLFPEERNYTDPGKESSFKTSATENLGASRNLILFGPPGTGKTYNTINNAVKIINPQLYDEISKSEESEKQKRKELKKEFNDLLNAGQIAFTTFHQSFGYEDFVEGLKVMTSDDRNLDYSIQPGIFKQICNTATVSSNDSLQQLNVAIEKLKEQLIEEPIRLKTDAHKKEFTLTYSGNTAFYAKPDAGKYNNPVSIDSIKKLYINPEIKSGSNGVHFKIYALPVIQYLTQHYKIPNYQEPQKKLNKQHVLIIDEINRGNISKIFGELITLIEPDKRADQDEELTVTLPYSKEAFSVPNNVHILGTMNTADASLAKLDIALRRRFDFIEMPPEPKLLKDTKVAKVNLSEMLTAINKRIEVLYDRDHTVGHSFFMKLSSDSTLSDLADVFKKNIIPLLQEYFFEDWERIHWVLDCLKDESNPDIHFVTKKYTNDEVNRLMGKNWSEYNKENHTNIVWELNDKAFGQAESYIKIYPEDQQAADE